MDHIEYSVMIVSMGVLSDPILKTFGTTGRMRMIESMVRRKICEDLLIIDGFLEIQIDVKTGQ